MDDDSFIDELLSEADTKWKGSSTAKEIKEEIEEVVVDFFEPLLHYEKNKENMKNILEKLSDYIYIHPDEPIFPGRYIRYLDSKYYDNCKLSKGEIVLKYEPEKDIILLKRFRGIFKIKKSKVCLFMKLNKTDKFRAFLNEYGDEYV